MPPVPNHRNTNGRRHPRAENKGHPVNTYENCSDTLMDGRLPKEMFLAGKLRSSGEASLFDTHDRAMSFQNHVLSG